MTTSQLLIDSVLERATPGSDGFNCFREGTGYRLQLWGRLPPEWAGNLALHTFVAGIQVVTADAMRTAHGTWAASFLLQTNDPRERVHHDFVNMARRGPRLIPDLPQPAVAVGIRLSQEFPGNAYARVVGEDSIGLIAHVLRRFADHGLVPRRFILRTRGAEIEDWFWLEQSQSSAAKLTPITELDSEWEEPNRTNNNRSTPSSRQTALTMSASD